MKKDEIQPLVRLVNKEGQLLFKYELSGFGGERDLLIEIYNQIMPLKDRVYKNKKKAQDAREAIRPTSVFNTPEKVASYLSKDQLDLYKLIWQRFVASQMAQALINQVTVSR